MKSTTMNLMLATAALLVASTAASAQTLKAEIPFAFQAGGKVMASGTYTVKVLNAETQFQIRGRDGGVMLGAGVREDAPRTWKHAGNPILEFACYADGGCALRRVWTGADGIQAHKFAASKRSAGDARGLAAIRLISIQAE